MLGRALPSRRHVAPVSRHRGCAELAGRAERAAAAARSGCVLLPAPGRRRLHPGPYEWQAPRRCGSTAFPEDFSYKLWNDDLERLEKYIEAALRARADPRHGRRPAGGQRADPVFAGRQSLYRPGARPAQFLPLQHVQLRHRPGRRRRQGDGRMGDRTGRPNGISGALDPRRYTGYATQSFTVAKAVEVYQNEYAPAFPLEERPAGRPLRRSPLYGAAAGKGCASSARAAAGNGRRGSRRGAGAAGPACRSGAARVWFEAVGREVRAVREAVGLIDLPGFSKWIVAGPGAEACLDRLVCSRLPRRGRIGLAYALTRRGRIVSEFTHHATGGGSLLRGFGGGGRMA